MRTCYQIRASPDNNGLLRHMHVSKSPIPGTMGDC
jgi:hypothetical protein